MALRLPGGLRLLLAFAIALCGVLVPLDTAWAFTDVSGSTPYSDAIEELSGRGIVSGFPDGTFHPQDPVTRQQFAKMAVLTGGYPVSEADTCLFVDVPHSGRASLYPDNYIAVCSERGIAMGETASRFDPSGNITRYQVVSMVVRMADDLQPGLLATPGPAYAGTAAWASDATHGANARRAEYNGLLSGLPLSTLDPDGRMTRGEVAQVLSNFLSSDGSSGSPAQVPVTSIVDGDTIHVTLAGRDESVRLIGIDAPETGEPFSQQAKNALTTLVGGKTVRLETDVDERDQYGRLLAYVWVGEVLADAEMLRLGLATLYTVPPNVKYVSLLQAAQHEAQTANRGIWGASTSSPLQIVQAHYDAAGNDNYNLNDEYIVFKVLVSGSLLGYSVEDQSGHHYGFPDRIFKAGQTFKLHSGAGTDTDTDLYWGATGSAIWNNDGDTVKVLDPEGHVLTSYSY